jgi:sulfite reductase (NADPH) flavoprotein alpha-component
MQIPMIPESAPFSAGQRHWLNGFLAAYFGGLEGAQGGGALAAEGRVSAEPVLLLYGSQTGSAEGLSKKYALRLSREGAALRAISMEAFAEVDWSKERRLLIAASTYGDGEPPDSARGFWEWLKTDAASVLSGVEYSVLALGDSNYAQFCQFGREVDARLEALGGQCIAERVECDGDPAQGAEQWFGRVRDWVMKGGSSGGSRGSVMALEDAVEEKSGWSKARPYSAVLKANRVLSGKGSAKEVRHFEMDLGGSGLSYEPGDALGVFPTNCPEVVDALIAHLGCDGEEAVEVAGVGEVALRNALTRHCDVGRPSRELLALAGVEKAPEGMDVLELLVDRRPSLDAAGLVKGCRALQPRLYSISSSVRRHPGEVHLTVGVVRYEREGRLRKGVCSTFLADRASEAVPVFVHEGKSFRLPADGDRPVIMVGPGTGIAPFRAFLEEREVSGARGGAWLFFGDQHRASDFLYEEELNGFLERGVLSRLETAFSRDQVERVYVQHRMREHGAELWGWLQEGAHFYVCGDASRMAKDVELALLEECCRHGGLEEAGALEFLGVLRKEGRYQRDVY